MNDLERPIHTLLLKRCVFRSPPQDLNEDRPILSAAKCRPMTVVYSSFWRYMIYSNIREGTPGRGRQTRVWLSRTQISAFSLAVFLFFRYEASFFIWRYAVRRGLSSDPAPTFGQWGGGGRPVRPCLDPPMSTVLVTGSIIATQNSPFIPQRWP